jgi:hypothetical protein
VMPNWRRNPSMLDGTMAGGNRGGGSHSKDICGDLPH